MADQHEAPPPHQHHQLINGHTSPNPHVPDDLPGRGGMPGRRLARAPTVKVLSSQIGGDDDAPLPYTADPFDLCWEDIKLLAHKLYLFPVIFYPWSRHPDDETYLQRGNIISLLWQVLLTLYQLVFILSLPLCFWMPLSAFLIYVAVSILICVPIWMRVNGRKRLLKSDPRIASASRHRDEHWVFINGVAVGKYWLQANIDRLARIFRRQVTGVHNPTNGLIFDLIQCMIERNFSYSTQDVRDAYKVVKEALLDPSRKKIVLILHSQGGIQGSLMVDWLLAELPDDILRKVEVYTLGCAANHFNNPHRHLGSDRQEGQPPTANEKAIRYIEHYANDGDMVAQWGVLYFTRVPNRFMGRLFERQGTGHLLNQHYLNYMFPLGPDGRVLENNDFMDEPVVFDEEEIGGLDTDREGLENLWRLRLRVPAHIHSHIHPQPHSRSSSCSSSSDSNNSDSTPPSPKHPSILPPLPLPLKSSSPSSTDTNHLVAPSPAPNAAVVVVNGDSSPVVPASFSSNPDNKITGSRQNSASANSGAVIDIDIDAPQPSQSEDERRRAHRQQQRQNRGPRVKDFSRLWQYRNGRSPRD
ncbi:hypothetical protein IWZ03DRAFT_412909 [Phyllosticta citriasiana]|uniref:Uncharacterized protein n=1 Tax=Phyllosticta citriasiana TaxID=595635 RepID=A0ABR1KRG9_9PEZI